MNNHMNNYMNHDVNYHMKTFSIAFTRLKRSGILSFMSKKKMVNHLHDLHGSSDNFAKFVFHKRLILKRELYEKQR